MAGRGFCVKIQLELHAVTCPGVWLCPNGEVALRISSLGSCLESQRVSPIFPLLFHDKFNFKKTFTRLAALIELQRRLEQEFLHAELIQWLGSCGRPIVLATFETNLADVLYPVPRYKGLLAGVDVDLLMDPTKYFPGIIVPKIEISTKTTIEEAVGVCDASVGGARVINPKTLDSKRTSCAHRSRPVKGIIRQRKVCHSRAKPEVQICRPASYRCALGNAENVCQGEQLRPNERYHPTSGEARSLRDANARRRNHRGASICDDSHLFECCPVCSKYKCYFSAACGGEPCIEESILDGRKDNLKDVESFDRIDLCDVHRCCTCRPEDSSASCEATPALHSKGQRCNCLQEKKGKLYCAERYGKARAVSECKAVYKRDGNEAKQGFYRNLERFYKRMYKQAKLRALEACG